MRPLGQAGDLLPRAFGNRHCRPLRHLESGDGPTRVREACAGKLAHPIENLARILPCRPRALHERDDRSEIVPDAVVKLTRHASSGLGIAADPVVCLGAAQRASTLKLRAGGIEGKPQDAGE